MIENWNRVFDVWLSRVWHDESRLYMLMDCLYTIPNHYAFARLFLSPNRLIRFLSCIWLKSIGIRKYVRMQDSYGCLVNPYEFLSHEWNLKISIHTQFANPQYTMDMENSFELSELVSIHTNSKNQMLPYYQWKSTHQWSRKKLPNSYTS